jgi:hypothetical protein
MTPAKELPIVIEKSSDEVEQIVALVQASNLPEATKPFVSCGSVLHSSSKANNLSDLVICVDAT